MSPVAAFKFISQIDPSGTECPKVISISQILRTVTVLALLALAITIFSLSASLNGVT